MEDLNEERLRKEEGVFSADHDAGRDVGCDPEEDRCAPDEETYDPADRHHLPGTQDDVPMSMGEDEPHPADIQIETGASGGSSTRGFGAGAAVPEAAFRNAPSTMDANNVAAEGVTSAPTSVGGVDAEDIDDIDTLAAADERELWRGQAPLIEEDEREGYNLEGFSDEEAERVVAAIGEDATEANPELPGGTSATGASSPLEPPHGGFPEREG